jgi:hypothetical protein
MSKKKSDVKFIIYQSLYIFVVCVIAIKGANLDLVQVVADDGKEVVKLRPEQMDSINKLLERAIIVDTTIFVVVPKSLLAEDEKLRQIVMNMPKIDISNYVLKSEVPKMPDIQKEEKKDEKIEPSETQEIRIGNISFTQFTVNTLNNPYDVAMEIVGVATIPPKSSKSFELGNQSSVVVKVGTSSKTVDCKENKKPKINMMRVASMGEDARVSALQSSVGYRVSIDDDFPGQLEVKFSGPVTVKQQGSTYDVTLNAFTSKTSFDNYTDNKTAPYSVGFTVSVTDKIAGHKMTGQGSFTFGEW